MYLPKNELPNNERFNKVFKKINSTYEDRASLTHLPQSSTDNSFYADKSIGYSEERELKLIPSLKTKSSIKRPKSLIDDESAMYVLFAQKQVIVNRQRCLLKTLFIPTSNGMKFILHITQTFYVNLSWLHSVQQLQKSKLLILYYDMYHLGSKEYKNQPKIESLILEFINERQMTNMLNAVEYVHTRYHDEDVEKLYHLLCGGEKKER